MPHSEHRSSDVSALGGFLGETLHGSLVTEEPVTAGFLPLVVLQWEHLRAAFAFADVEVEESYAALYAGFKQLYAKNRDSWQGRDRAFVFCMKPESGEMDAFCSSIETDVYFCRKFVVELRHPLRQSLSRLPFIPLAPIEGRRSIRPPSAQALLKANGVTARLASGVVVPGPPGPDRIVDECLSGQLGEPTLGPVKSLPGALLSDRGASPVILDSIEIENFRAYRKRASFELGRGVTVLYGPNGFGKTSFFDAVDFAVTGGIHRMSQKRASFERAAVHLDGRKQESTVSLGFRVGASSPRTVVRTVAGRNHPKLDGRTVDRKAVLSALTGFGGAATANVENVVTLFRATHLFSQEQQELVAGFNDDSLPAATVSRMLAFEDYAAATKKAGNICDHLRRELASLQADIAERRESLGHAQRTLAAQRLSVPTVDEDQRLDSALSDLRNGLLEIGIDSDLPGLPVPAANLRSLRAELERRLEEAASALDRVGELASRASAIDEARSSIRGDADAVVLVEAERSQLRVQLAAVRREHTDALDSAKEASGLELRLREIRDGLEKWNTWRIQRQKLTADRAKVAATQATNESELARALAERDAQSARAYAIEQRLSQTDRAMLSSQTQLGRIEDLEVRASRFREQARRRVAALSEHETVSGREADARLVSDRAGRAAVETRVAEAALAAKVQLADRDQSELRKLLLALQAHVNGPNCPLCGVNHTSRDSLLSAIGSRVEFDPAAVARAELANARQKIAELDSEMQGADELAKGLKAERDALADEIAALRSELSMFEQMIEAIGISATSPVKSVEEALAEGRLAALEHSKKLTVQLGDLKAELAVESGLLQHAAADADSWLEASKRTKAELERLDSELRGLGEDPRATAELLEIEPSQAEARLTAVRSELARAVESRVQRVDQSKECERRALEVAGKEKELTSLISKMRTGLADKQGQVALFDSAARELVGEAESIGTALEHERQGLHAKRRKLASLRDRTKAIEMAVDSLTTAASSERLRVDIQIKEKELAVVEERLRSHEPWLEYFQSVSGLLADEQTKAIAAFTTEYGPRASTIQKRLRPVYGFEHVEVKEKGASIQVRVWRRGEELHPTHYFSQSQVQTLLLSLFLTACISQTWSSFSPIFMDDPVTHFDDLNTYAFLDLIAGLLDVEGEARQFVISTCDDKFLQLAKSKFRHLGDKARFYRFSAIGADGPVVADET